MILVLDAMLAVAGLVLVFVAPWAFNWINSTIRENHLLRKMLQVFGALVILVPAVSLGISQVQQRTARLSPEVTQQLGVAAGMAWGAICLIAPAVILSCGDWDKKNKEAFRVAIGFCLCVNVALLGWTLVNEVARIAKQGEPVVLVGPLRWAVSVGLFALVVFDYFMLKLSHRVYPLDEPQDKPPEAVVSVVALPATPEPAPKAARSRRRRRKGEAAPGTSSDAGAS